MKTVQTWINEDLRTPSKKPQEWSVESFKSKMKKYSHIKPFNNPIICRWCIAKRWLFLKLRVDPTLSLSIILASLRLTFPLHETSCKNIWKPTVSSIRTPNGRPTKTSPPYIEDPSSNLQVESNLSHQKERWFARWVRGKIGWPEDTNWERGNRPSHFAWGHI